jgi:hypothetical protein
VPAEYIERLLPRIDRARRVAAPLVGMGSASLLTSNRFAGTELRLGDELVALTVFPTTA